MTENDWSHFRGLCQACRRNINTIYLHTVAKRGDTTIEKLRRFHVENKGWRDVGYHFLIRKDGSIEEGRSLDTQGAGVRGDNKRSVHVVFSGHGDYEEWTEEQDSNGITFLALLREELEIHEADLLGHREGPNVRKTCPGKLINMHMVREAVQAMVESEIEVEYDTEGLELA